MVVSVTEYPTQPHPKSSGIFLFSCFSLQWRSKSKMFIVPICSLNFLLLFTNILVNATISFFVKHFFENTNIVLLNPKINCHISQLTSLASFLIVFLDKPMQQSQIYFSGLPLFFSYHKSHAKTTLQLTRFLPTLFRFYLDIYIYIKIFKYSFISMIHEIQLQKHAFHKISSTFLKNQTCQRYLSKTYSMCRLFGMV